MDFSENSKGLFTGKGRDIIRVKETFRVIRYIFALRWKEILFFEFKGLKVISGLSCSLRRDKERGVVLHDEKHF